MFVSDISGALLARLCAAVLAAAVGSGLAVSLKKISHLGLCLLISFAAGALLAVTLLDLIPEAMRQAGSVGGLVSVATGYLVFYALTRYVFHVCPACSATHTEVRFRAITVSMVVALSIHSLMDGLAVYGGAASHEETGLMVLMAVAFHKFPEGLALTLVALGSGMKRYKAFLLAVSVEACTTLLGGFLGLWLHLADHSLWMGIVLGHVGGGFLFLAYHALLSDFVKHHPKHTFLSAMAGAACIGLLQFFHSH